MRLIDARDLSIRIKQEYEQYGHTFDGKEYVPLAKVKLEIASSPIIKVKEVSDGVDSD